MQKNITVKLLPSEVNDAGSIRQHIAATAGCSPEDISGYSILKQSIDARSRHPYYILTLSAYIKEPFIDAIQQTIHFDELKPGSKKVIVIGAGPAGLFAALKLIENGIQPIILERGKDVRLRRRDLAAMNKAGIVNAESNYCFGEGGAGTYSDGKLYTRSSKRGDVKRILNLLVQFGAADNILYNTHPHIGTNKLPQIITAIREQIVACGGIFLFDKKVTALSIKDEKVRQVITADGDIYEGEAVILATGHSARDIFYLLHNNGLQLQFKPFALGVRVEHPQHIIDQAQYHCQLRDNNLPPASYSLVQQVDKRGVFSFCMCPGGIIAPAATSPGEIVVNGWSPSKRNNPFANSGMVVTINEADTLPFQSSGVMAGLAFQQAVEQQAYKAGGGGLQAPAQRLTDFVTGHISATLPACSYLPGITAADLSRVLPPFVYTSLQDAFKAFGKKMKGYFTNEAVVVATESRTSSPVRIPRHVEALHHPQVTNLYPCGEGAGYAGGIISAAMDGEKLAAMIAIKINS